MACVGDVLDSVVVIKMFKYKGIKMAVRHSIVFVNVDG